MKKHLKNHLKILLFFGIFFLALSAGGKRACAETKILDSADLFSTEEEELLRQECDTILSYYGTSVYIVTSDSIGKNDDYKSYIAKLQAADDAPKQLVILFLSTKEKGHLCKITASGAAKTSLTQKRRKKLKRQMRESLSAHAYYDAAETFCGRLSAFLNRPPRVDRFIFQAIPQLLLSFLLSVGVLYAVLRGPRPHFVR